MYFIKTRKTGRSYALTGSDFANLSFLQLNANLVFNIAYYTPINHIFFMTST